jgi:diaminopimelate decarboxylase
VSCVADLIGRYFPESTSELVVGGLPVGDLVRRHGTPLFVYDARVLDCKWTLLRNALPAEFEISYSVKANPNRAILRHFLAKGCGLEVASAGELLQALASGCPADRILFAGPGKTESELELALAKGVGEIHIESCLEARRIGDLARRLGCLARAAVRVNPGGQAQGGAMRMGGKPVPFGIDEERLDDCLDQILDTPSIELRGLHLFAGTQILDHTVLLRQYQAALAIARRVAARLGRPLHTLDFGGGLGIPYFDVDRELDMAKLGEELGALVTSVRADPLLAGTRFVVEPGRYLVGEAGIYVTRVNDVKVSRGKTFVIVDGGMHHHLAASGNLGQVIKRNFPIALVNRLSEPASSALDVVGPLCTPLDTLARDVALPTPSVGDLVGVFQSGAYALTASPVHFLSHAAPAEVLVANRRDEVIRPRGSWGTGADEV